MARLKRRIRSFGGWNDDAKPMDGVSNLSDAMLVFACGLMISIAANWNVDLMVQKVEVTPEQSVNETDFNEVVNNNSDDDVYQELGKVYVDPETGEMYMVTE